MFGVFGPELIGENGPFLLDGHMIELIEELRVNYKAIIHSNRLSDCKKNMLLKNLLKDIESIFFKSSSKEPSLVESQKEAAKQLYQDIKKNLLSS